MHAEKWTNLEYAARLIMTGEYVVTPPRQETAWAPKPPPPFPTMSPAPVSLTVTSAWPLLPFWRPRKPDLIWLLSLFIMKRIVLATSFLIWFALYFLNLFLERLSPLACHLSSLVTSPLESVNNLSLQIVHNTFLFSCVWFLESLPNWWPCADT